ncbi:MAG: hypothetical protein KAV83_07190 [Desulfobacterales bacterium]|nr:hypothetical protein [Desulfobacterales bacterium]
MGYVLVPMLCVGTHHMGALRPGSNNTDWTQSVQPFGYNAEHCNQYILVLSETMAEARLSNRTG